MKQSDAPTLIGGPYHPAHLDVGTIAECRHKGDVRVGPLSDAPIPWPLGHYAQGGGKWVPILCGDLVRAVEVESAQAVAYWWGVHIATVQRWRRALGVERMTEGTRRIWSEAARKLHRKGRKK